MAGYSATRSVLRQIGVFPPELDWIVAEYAVIHEWSAPSILIPTLASCLDRSLTSTLSVSDGPKRWIVHAYSSYRTVAAGSFDWQAGVCIGPFFCRFLLPRSAYGMHSAVRKIVMFAVDIRRKTVAATTVYSNDESDTVTLVTADSDFAPDDFGLFRPYVEFSNHVAVTIEPVL